MARRVCQLIGGDRFFSNVYQCRWTLCGSSNDCGLPKFSWVRLFTGRHIVPKSISVERQAFFQNAFLQSRLSKQRGIVTGGLLKAIHKRFLANINLCGIKNPIVKLKVGHKCHLRKHLYATREDGIDRFLQSRSIGIVFNLVITITCSQQEDRGRKHWVLQ